MGAWTSAFMIGITSAIAYTSSVWLALRISPINLFCNPIPQWDCFTPLTNDSEDICALLRGIPEFSILWPAG
jgi:hypothetical protein